MLYSSLQFSSLFIGRWGRGFFLVISFWQYLASLLFALYNVGRLVVPEVRWVGVGWFRWGSGEGKVLVTGDAKWWRCGCILIPDVISVIRSWCVCVPVSSNYISLWLVTHFNISVMGSTRCCVVSLVVSGAPPADIQPWFPQSPAPPPFAPIQLYTLAMFSPFHPDKYSENTTLLYLVNCYRSMRKPFSSHYHCLFTHCKHKYTYTHTLETTRWFDPRELHVLQNT